MIAFLQNIPFGVITGSVLVLLTTVLLLAGGLWLLQQGVKLLLNSSHPKAPKYDWGNVFFSLLSKLFYYQNQVDKKFGGWCVRSAWLLGYKYYDRVDGDSWCSSTSIEKYCVFTDKEEALALAKEKYHPCLSIDLSWVLVLLLLDAVVYLLPIYFLPTVSIVSLVVVAYGVRKLAGFVYENTSNIEGHEERITTLETKGE